MKEHIRFQPRRFGDETDIRKFADLLDTTVINLYEAGHLEELPNGTLYTKFQKKIPDEKRSQYYTWIDGRTEQEIADTLRKWVIQETAFQTVIADMICGLKDHGNKYRRKEKSYFADWKT